MFGIALVFVFGMIAMLAIVAIILMVVTSGGNSDPEKCDSVKIPPVGKIYYEGGNGFRRCPKCDERNNPDFNSCWKCHSQL